MNSDLTLKFSRLCSKFRFFLIAKSLIKILIQKLCIQISPLKFCRIDFLSFFLSFFFLFFFCLEFDRDFDTKVLYSNFVRFVFLCIFRFFFHLSILIFHQVRLPYLSDCNLAQAACLGVIIIRISLFEMFACWALRHRPGNHSLMPSHITSEYLKQSLFVCLFLPLMFDNIS